MIIFLLAIFLIGICTGLGLYCVDLEKRIKDLEFKVKCLKEDNNKF